MIAVEYRGVTFGWSNNCTKTAQLFCRNVFRPAEAGWHVPHYTTALLQGMSRERIKECQENGRRVCDPVY